MIAKPAETPIISFSNNTPLVEFNQGKHPVKSKIEDSSEKRPYFTQTGEYHFVGPWRIEVRKRHNARKILCSTQYPGEISMLIGGNLVRLSKESGVQKTRLISLDCHLPYLIHVFLSVKNTGLKKLIRVRVIFPYLPEINNCWHKVH